MSNTKLKILQDGENGEQFYPYTHADAVITDDGSKFGDKLSELQQNVGVFNRSIQVDKSDSMADVTIDATGKIIESTNADGIVSHNTKHIFNAEVEVLGMEVQGLENTQYVNVVIDEEGKVIEATKKNGTKVFFADISSPTIDELKAYSKGILNGKKYAFAGDSFTEADFSALTGEDGKVGQKSISLYDKERSIWKSYAWWIVDRNNMAYYADGISGSTMTITKDGDGNITNPNAFSNTRYKSIPVDTDYLTIAFGLNETSVNIGTRDSKDCTTLWGAYNTILEYYLTNMPFMKIGIIISDAWLKGTAVHTAMIEIAKYWGIPYLDLTGDDKIPMLINGKEYGVSSKAIELRNSAFQVSSDDSHPNPKCHEYRSTIIENFIKTL